MLKPHRKPYGYKDLLVYKKAEALQKETEVLTRKFPKTKTLIDLADQMVRSARSGKQNIVEDSDNLVTSLKLAIKLTKIWLKLSFRQSLDSLLK